MYYKEKIFKIIFKNLENSKKNLNNDIIYFFFYTYNFFLFIRIIENNHCNKYVKMLCVKLPKFFNFNLWYMGIAGSYLSTVTATLLSVGFTDIESP